MSQRTNTITEEILDEWTRENNSGNGFVVGFENHTNEEAGIEECWILLDTDKEGRALFEDTSGGIILVCDVHGPWGCFVS